MHLYILGICGTFMGGVAMLARQAGHRVSGADRNVYPPMSTQLERLGVALHEGYGEDALDAAGDVDVVVVGNVMSRGSGAIERMLETRMPYTSGPAWLAQNVLPGRHVLAVAGTHGKSSTASMLAWILDCAGLEPGFLIGGVPVDFGVSARLGGSKKLFVVEADEYDTAFFDKRSKFVHYDPSTLVITNIEHDHADIFPDLAAICRQFHHLIRTVPRNGRIVAVAGETAVDELLAMGCWTPVERYGAAAGDWTVSACDGGIEVGHGGQTVRGAFAWPGRHNRLNALAACAAAHAVGVPLATSVEALGRWRGVRRRLERLGETRGITIYDDFAHHPTEIAATLEALRERIGQARLVAVLEPRSNSMKLGTHRHRLGAALAGADIVLVHRPPGLEWDVAAALRQLQHCHIEADCDALLRRLLRLLQPGDHVVCMSNGDFGGLPGRLLDNLNTP